MLVTIEFHKSLQQFTGVASHTISIGKLSSIKDALVALFPRLRKYIYQISHGLIQENLSLITKDGTVLGRKEYFKDTIQHSNLTLVPLIGGAGGGSGGSRMSFVMLAIGVALIASAAFTGGATIFGGAGFVGSTGMFFGATTAATVLKIGVALTISGLMATINKPPESPGASTNQRRDNNMFGIIDNTTDPNTPVPLIYGMPRVGGQIISTHVETISHGESDTIYVRDLFYQTQSEITRVEDYIPPVPESTTPVYTEEEIVSEGVGGFGSGNVPVEEVPGE